MNKPKGIKLPSLDSPKQFADRFCEYFTTKIANIWNELFGTQSSQESPKPVIEDQVRKMIMATNTKSWSEDPIPISETKAKVEENCG
jgi:hypothetical protein